MMTPQWSNYILSLANDPIYGVQGVSTMHDLICLLGNTSNDFANPSLDQLTLLSWLTSSSIVILFQQDLWDNNILNRHELQINAHTTNTTRSWGQYQFCDLFVHEITHITELRLPYTSYKQLNARPTCAGMNWHINSVHMSPLCKYLTAVWIQRSVKIFPQCQGHSRYSKINLRLLTISLNNLSDCDWANLHYKWNCQFEQNEPARNVL